MTANIENFIFCKKNALGEDFINELIAEALRVGAEADRTNVSEFGHGYGDDQFDTGKLGRHDFQLFIPRVLHTFFPAIQDCIFEGLEEYQHVISSVKMQTLVSPSCKFQQIPVGGGYSVWHCEQGSGTSSNRSLAWMIYLNDVDNGGETEFLYQHLRQKPESGTLMIWPAGITHPHRGNPPYSNEKYILTGWFEVASSEVYQQAIEVMKATQKS